MYRELKERIESRNNTENFVYLFKKRDVDNSWYLSAKQIQDVFEEFVNFNKKPNERKDHADPDMIKSIL